MLKSLTFALLAAALLCTLPAVAAANPTQPATPSACPQPAPLFDFAAPQPNSTPAPPAWRTDSTPGPSTTIFHGYCACGCSTVKDCNTDADCSNNRCLKAISCC